MMSSSTLIFLIACGQFLLSVQGLTLRLKGKEMIPENGEVDITDLPVGGYRRYDSLECLSDVPYRGRVEKAYWEYTDPNTLKYYRVDDIHCKDDECKSPDIGWQSCKGIYKNGSSYYGVVRLGRTKEAKENAKKGVFTCYFEEDSNSPVSVNIIVESPTAPTEDCVLTAPTGIEIENKTIDNSYEKYNISWDEPPCDVDNYTIYFTTEEDAICQNETVNRSATNYLYEGTKDIQMAAHLNDMTNCTKVIEVKTGVEKENFDLPCQLNTDCYNG